MLPTLGGQTGLNLAMELYESGYPGPDGASSCWAPTRRPSAKAEDRQVFKDTMEKIGEPCIASKVVRDGGGRG